LKAAASEPLVFDIYGDESLTPRLPPGSDYWVTKRATDVIVLGSAFTLEKKPARTLEVSVRVADRVKRIAVFGRRAITARSGHLAIGEPEPFSEMPISYVYAYGGLDPRVPIPEADRDEYFQHAAAGVAMDHPGLYPRNPIGKGYLVYPEPLGGMEMPNLEDPDDLLGVDRLVAGEPELWYRQPLPWSLEWTNWLMYPRQLFLGFDAWFPCPDPAQLPEVKRGFLGARAAAPGSERQWPPDEGYQEASFGMIFRHELGGAPVQVSGMSPERPELGFAVPTAPAIDIDVDGWHERCAARLTQLVIRPLENKVNAIWLAKTSGLPRVLLPGIHANIRLAATINEGEPVRYACPTPIRERLAAARAASGAGGSTSSSEPPQ
ncbi:MAG TPA: DUF2169 domain-containing protein, partial [Candidatus Udaeobacter sp.]|nr:DUF2169 domain-containing protein [Candidatus Udaeobacter sp.]